VNEAKTWKKGAKRHRRGAALQPPSTNSRTPIKRRSGGTLAAARFIDASPRIGLLRLITCRRAARVLISRHAAAPHKRCCIRSSLRHISAAWRCMRALRLAICRLLVRSSYG
jgi:hypothetical protein